ncbi:DNA internalization-related competence protein ComEC/Rec2 [Pseudomonas sp. ISL-84]|nr:DNA internalization-related competence protein ComEC/Rec2 [Pseudomonas sp. ISL-84]
MTSLAGGEALFEVGIKEAARIDGDQLTVLVETVSNEKLMARYKIKSDKEKKILSNYLRVGLSCKVNGTLQTPPIATNPNAFSYKEYLNHNKIFWVLEIKQLILSDCSYRENSLPLSLLKMRETGINYLVGNFPEKTASIAVALIFGDRNFIEQDVLESYQKLGIIHLLAISGLHVGLLAGMFFLAGIRAGITREKMTSALILILPGYALITGVAPSVIRAVFMMLLVLAARKLKSAVLIIDVFSIVFMIYLFISPFILFNAGFQLSFAVSLSLILSAPLLLKRFSNPFVIIILVSFICQVAAMPILFWHFFEMSILSVFANLIFVPVFSSIVLPAILIIFLLHLLSGGKSAFLLAPFDEFITLIDYIAGKLSEIPHTSIVLGRPSLLVLLLYVLLIPVFFASWERSKGKKAFFLSCILPVFALLLHFFTTSVSPKGEVTFIDVGQGDSILVKLPYGKGNYLIDTGGTVSFQTKDWKIRSDPFEAGKDIVVPFLKSKGISSIDKLILTHGDMDHIGGAAAIIDEIRVKAVILPIVSEISELEQEVIHKAKRRNSKVLFSKAGDRWTEGEGFFQILSPQEEIKTERNDGSIVLFAKLGGLSWLFTGDIEAEGEERLVQNYPNLKIDVLKAGHHGSKTSSTDLFLSSVKPKIAIISAGENNRYGHPHTDVISRFRSNNIRILRTDEHGAVTYIFKGNSGTFYVQLP